MQCVYYVLMTGFRTMHGFLSLVVLLAWPFCYGSDEHPAFDTVVSKGCLAYLQEIVRAIEDPTFGNVTLTNQPSVRFLSNTFPGNHGGTIHVVDRDPTLTWGSSYFSDISAATQGDPRSFPYVLGREAARFFGYHLVSDTSMHVPDVAEMNGAIEQINLRLLPERRISLRFYDAPLAILAVYLRKFAMDGLLPVAPEGTHRIHDLSFHTSAIFIPEVMIQHARRQTEALVRFTDFLRGAHPDFYARPEVTAWIRGMREQQASAIDAGTANISIEVLTTPQATDEDIPLMMATRLIQDGVSPSELLREMARRKSSEPSSSDSIRQRFLDYVEEFDRIERARNAEYGRTILWGREETERSLRILVCWRQMCPEFRTRLQEIQAAATALSRRTTTGLSQNH